MRVISIQESANRKNLFLLVMLRWLAVGGQVVTILLVHFWIGVALPLDRMSGVILGLVGLNLIGLYRCRGQAVITNAELFVELLLDVAALSVQLYLSGGATNPFISLFLLQVTLGAMLLRPAATWTLVGVTGVCFLSLTMWYRPLELPPEPYLAGLRPSALFDLHIYGMFICFLIGAVLLVPFMTRITQNLRDRDQRLAELRQQSVEEEHIVRMGLLASGAAHELGTPLATLSVILNDWERMPALRADPELDDEIGEMRAALACCKDIVSRILVTAGEARGENAERTTLVAFLDDVVADWRETRAPLHLEYTEAIEADAAIVSDKVIRQILANVLDNALEASPAWVGVRTAREDDQLVVTVRDKGTGFAPEILSNFGKPYQSTKQRPGSGLGLFLVVNVLRKIGGSVVPRNEREGGASVELRLPIGALAIENEMRHAVG